MCEIKNFLSNQTIKICDKLNDGRINSSIDETIIIDLLIHKFESKIIKPKTKRPWYDLLVYDDECGWLPTNLKTTTMKTADNTGNMAMCVYGYTNYKLDIFK